MDRKTFESNTIRYLSGELDQDETFEFEQYLEKNLEFRKLFHGLRQMWGGVSNMAEPRPSMEMHERFYDMLRTETELTSIKENRPVKNIREYLEVFSIFRWKVPLGYGMLLMLLGLVCGFFFRIEKSVRDVVPDETRIEQVHEKFVLTLLDLPSATKRLEAVNETNRLENVSGKVIDALFVTLNNDLNINVRLACVEALAKYASDPEVRTGLVRSIAGQESPMVQIALAGLMAKLQEKESIESLKRLLERDDIDERVRQKLQESLDQII